MHAAAHTSSPCPLTALVRPTLAGCSRSRHSLFLALRNRLGELVERELAAHGYHLPVDDVEDVELTGGGRRRRLRTRHRRGKAVVVNIWFI